MPTFRLRWFIDYEPSDALVADIAEVFRQSAAPGWQGARSAQTGKL